MAFYTYCQSHQLNLCVVKACSIPQIRNASGVLSEIAKFYNYSPKRQHFFEHVIDVESPTETKKLKDLCKTRWVQFHLWYCEIKTLADELKFSIATPRITAKQIHRTNRQSRGILPNKPRDSILGPYHHRVDQRGLDQFNKRR